MNFMNPSLFIWGGFLLAPIILYLFRRKPEDVPVSTLLFFKSLAREHQESAWLRRLKRLLSFLLSVFVICACVAALVQVVVSPPSGTLKSAVFLVDRSASMGAVKPDGETSLESAISELRKRLEGLSDGISVSVVAYDKRAEVLLARSLDRRKAQRALSKIEVRPIEGDPDSALRLAKRLGALDPPSVVWHATDCGSFHEETASGGEKAQGNGGEEGQGNRASEPAGTEKEPNNPDNLEGGGSGKVRVSTLYSGPGSPVNAGITMFALRPRPLEHARYDGFVQVHFSGEKTEEVKLDVRLDGTLIEVRSFDMEPGGKEQLIIPVKGGEGRALTLEVKAEGDMLPVDNTVNAWVPEFEPVSVIWIAQQGDPFTQLALASLSQDGAVEVFQGKAENWPPEESFDVAVFSNWLPESWPEDLPVVLLDPPRSLGPVRLSRIGEEGIPVDRLRAPETEHPLLYGVAHPRISLTQTCVLETTDGLEPLWVGPAGPILSAGEVRDQCVVVMGFAPERSVHLPLTASYPLLLGNAVYWAVQSKKDRAGNNYKTGEAVELEGETITWLELLPEGKLVEKTTQTPTGNWAELHSTGLWRSQKGGKGSASLLSKNETCLTGAEGSGGSSSKGTTPGTSAFLSGDLTWLFLWALVVVLVVENWLFHRHGVY